MAFDRTKTALDMIKSLREEARFTLNERTKTLACKHLTPNGRANRERQKELLEKRIAAFSYVIDFVTDQLNVLEARGEPNVVRNYSCLGSTPVLTAEQLADVARAERECVSILDWYNRRAVSGNMPEPHFTNGTKGVHAIRNCLDILRTLPVAAPRTPGQKAFEMQRSYIEAGHKPGSFTPVTWASLTEVQRQQWENIAEAARK